MALSHFHASDCAGDTAGLVGDHASDGACPFHEGGVNIPYAIMAATIRNTHSITAIIFTHIGITTKLPA